MLTKSEKAKIEKELSDHAREEIKIDREGAGIIYCFISELLMYRIAEKMRLMENFNYGYLEEAELYHIRIDLNPYFKRYEKLKKS